jgi:hypothetical protein
VRERAVRGVLAVLCERFDVEADGCAAVQGRHLPDGLSEYSAPISIVIP